MTPQQLIPEQSVSHVVAFFDRVYAELHSWRDAIEALGSNISPAELDDLVEKLVVPCLAETNPLFIGAGFIASPRYVRGRDVHFAWWLGPLEANPLLGTTATPTRLDLSTRVYTEYVRDFRELEWYAVPVSTQSTHVTGPYVDQLCTCDYIITVTAPVRVNDEMIGVVGADVAVKRLEEEFLPRFLLRNSPMVLVNNVGRIVVSTDPARPAGEILHDAGQDIDYVACPGTPFRIAVASGPANR